MSEKIREISKPDGVGANDWEVCLDYLGASLNLVPHPAENYSRGMAWLFYECLTRERAMVVGFVTGMIEQLGVEIADEENRIQKQALSTQQHILKTLVSALLERGSE